MNYFEQSQYYTVEIYSRAQSIIGQCESLLTEEFASDAPKNLAYSIIEMCRFFQSAAIAFHNDSKQDVDEISIAELRNLDNAVKEIGEHVKHVDSARIPRTPWSIIPTFEKLANDLLGNVEIIFCPLWGYNYEIHMRDLKSLYENTLNHFNSLYDIPYGVNDCLNHLKHSLYIIRFPSSERLNFRLHANIGHELGHMLAHKYIDGLKDDSFLSPIRSDIVKITDKYMEIFKASSDISFTKKEESNTKTKLFTQLCQRAIKTWRRALEEIISDITSCIIFGPASLFSLYDIAIQSTLDHTPNYQTKYYPPMRYRLRIMIRILDEICDDIKFFPISEIDFDGKISKNRKKKLDKLYNSIKAISESNDDIQSINKDDIADLVYQQLDSWIKKGTDFLLKKSNLKQNVLTAEKLYKELHWLIERLDHGIIPNAIEHNVNNRKPVEISTILNCAWYYWLTQDKTIETEIGGDSTIYKNRVKMNNLCLKAVEYAFVEKRYRNKLGDPKAIDPERYITKEKKENQ